jgi:putative phage-type endonuclease
VTATMTPSWAYPAARLVLPADAERKAWLDERRLGIGGSDTPVLLGESPYDKSLYGLWLDKTGQVGHDSASDAMRRGNWLEPHLARWFVEETGLQVRRCGLLASKERDHLRTSVDRLTADGGVLEIKTHSVYADVAKEWRYGGISRSAYIQAQQQLAVTGRSHAWFVAWMDPTPQLRGPVDRDEPLIAQIIAATDRFWLDHVVPRIAPEVDLATVTDDEIALRWPTEIKGTTVESAFPAHTQLMLAERAEVKARMREDKKRGEELDTALRVMAADAEVLLVDGRPAVTFKSQTNNPSVDKALEADHPDIYAKYIHRSSSRRIRVLKQKEA